MYNNSKYTYVMSYLVFVGRYWSDANNQRKFFIEFASQKGFDPLVTENWNKVKPTEILQQVKK